jgi:archaellum component FlaG (FlaF/FlaG flagellin family)
VTLSVPASIAAGNFTVVANGTSGTLMHSTSLPLIVTPAKDFALNVSPAQVSATLGTTSPAVSISVVALNGFTDTVTLTLSGLPAGVTVQPAGPWTLVGGQSQALTFSIPAASVIGVFTNQITAASGSISHAGYIGLTINPVITTSEDSTMLFLEARTSTDGARLGLLKTWGASITEVSLNGTNYVNHDDPGRQIQTSLWDGNATYGGTWGYNPIEAGDHFFNGSPVLASTLLTDSIYTKTQPIQWAPENFGGWTGPVLGDAYIEKWISVVPGYNRVFKVHYKITHFGTDSHADANQELPVMYVNPIVPNFFYYGGSAPWTNDALSQFAMPGGCCTVLPTPEQWGAYVDATNTGIALYTPMQYPNSKGFNAGSTLQFTPTCPYSWDPGAVLEFDAFILVGPVDESRAAIYVLHSQQSAASPLPAYGFLGPPNSGDTLSGSANITGWAWALSGISSIDVFVDGSRVASATYGLARPDVVSVQPGAPGDTGFQYILDTTKFPNGIHAIIVKATDKVGHIATFSTKQVTITN